MIRGAASDLVFPPDQPQLLPQFRKLLRESRVVDHFINEHLRGIPVDVERAGAPKGEPLRFARKKTNAALLHLKLEGELPGLDELARAADISYNLLGKWRTEARFRDAVERYTIDFSQLVVTFILAWIEDSSLDLNVPDVDTALGIIPDMKEVTRWSPDIRKRVYFLLARPDLSPKVKTTPGLKRSQLRPLERCLAGIIGFAVYKDLIPPGMLKEGVRQFRVRSQSIITAVSSQLDESIQAGDKVAALRHSGMLKAVTNMLLSLDI